MQISNMNQFLEAQGLLGLGQQKLEEGEILTRGSFRAVANLFGFDPNQAASTAVAPHYPESPPEDIEEIVIEDRAEAEYPNYRSPPNQNIPEFKELMRQKAEEEINRDAPAENVEIPDVRENVKAQMQSNKGWFKQIVEPNYMKCYTLQKNDSTGKIISWAYLEDLRCFAVKREKGMQYFRDAPVLQTLPYFDLHQLARLRCLYCDRDNLAAYFVRQLKFEFNKRNGWRVIKPLLPKIRERPDKIHPLTGKPSKVMVYPAPETMKVVHLRKLPQDFISKLQCWFYDYTTTEAVIVTGEDDEYDIWKDVRIFDPIWLRNLSRKDIEILYHNPIIHAVLTHS